MLKLGVGINALPVFETSLIKFNNQSVKSVLVKRKERFSTQKLYEVENGNSGPGAVIWQISLNMLIR